MQRQRISSRNLSFPMSSILIILMFASAPHFALAQQASFSPLDVAEAAESTTKPEPLPAITFRPVPHNDWTPATQITLNSKPYYSESAEKPYSLQFSTNTTSPIIRAEVRNGELWTEALGGNDTERAELDGSAYNHPINYPKGTEFWFAYQFRIERGADQIATAGGFPGGPLAWGVIGQIHGNGTEAAVPWALGIVGGRLSVHTQRGNQIDTIHWTAPSKFERNRVYDVVVRIKITGTTDSTMTCWIDGVQVANSTNLPIGGPDAGNYVKVGIYRGWQNDGYPPLAVQIANVEQGTASLMSRVTTRATWPSVK
jgi:hypothetical protein